MAGSACLRLTVLWFLMQAVLVGPAQAQQSVSYEIVRWDRTPIEIRLPVGVERHIWFPAKVQPGIPPELATKLRVQAVDDTVYLLAHKSFEATRVPVRDRESGQIFLFDLRAEAGAPQEPVRVVIASGRDEEGVLRSADANDAGNSAPDYGYMTLTRFAAQQLYAPSRLATPLSGVSRVPLGNREPITGLIRGGGVNTLPVASWRSPNGLYVTAIKVTNLLPESIAVDPRSVRGRWLAATVHHPLLTAHGGPADTSMIYLVSDRRFEESLALWLR